MSDEILSQEDLNALQAEGGAGDTAVTDGDGAEQVDTASPLTTQEELDAMLANAGASGAALADGDAAEQGDAASPPAETNVRMVSGPVVRSVEFGQLGYPADNVPKSGVDLIMDVNVQISVELGRSVMQVRDVLGLGPGSVVELDKHAGEPVEVVVNNKMVARGEVVVIDENFGVRITELVNTKGKESNAQAA